MRLTGGCLAEFASGCDVLAAGGGGEAAEKVPMAQVALAAQGPVEIVDLADLPPEGLVMPCAYLGSPAVWSERIGTGREGVAIRRQVETHFGREVVAMMCTEVGGCNGPASVALAAYAGLPLADADGMGRAFPGIEQVAMQVAGVQPGPSVLADDHDHVVLVQADTGDWLERLARSAVKAFGDTGVSTEYVMTVEQARRSVVIGSISRALRIGRLLKDCGCAPTKTAVIRLAEEFGGVCLMEGKVSSVTAMQGRPAFAANLRSSILLDGINGDSGRCLRVEASHEFLAVLEDGEVRATTPDIITLFDVYSGGTVATDSLRYGQRVVVLALPCPELWLQPAGLELVGPRAFGLDLDYHPLVAR
ncbi:DUF917 domain-containing protein [Actinocrispum sp. NPDC049592]|uniref:DUF917 domain-containing protein n=1 Tax=Actinocrispum sp. NPDC049592 TaxID=3154835 RepID=UPI0034497F32